MDPNIIRCIYKRREGETEGPRKEGCMKMEAETGVTLPQNQGTTGVTRRWKKQGKHSLQRESRSVDTLIPISGLLEDNLF